MDDAIDNWMEHHSLFLSRAIPIVFVVFGIALMVGAIKDWDTFYKPDDRDEGKWSLRQTSRYWGRRTARVQGFLGGIVFVIFGLTLCYLAFFKSK